jgi:hypothetical protein
VWVSVGDSEQGCGTLGLGLIHALAEHGIKGWAIQCQKLLVALLAQLALLNHGFHVVHGKMCFKW